MHAGIVFTIILSGLTILAYPVQAQAAGTQDYPVAEQGHRLRYSIQAEVTPASVVRSFTLTTGAVEVIEKTRAQWLHLQAEKANGDPFGLWLLASTYPTTNAEEAELEIFRYILCEQGKVPVAFAREDGVHAVLPNTGAWKYLLPRTSNGANPVATSAKEVQFLGHSYALVGVEQVEVPDLPDTILNLELTPELLIGVPHNKRVVNETRRYDESDYEYVEFTRAEYAEMIAHGMNVFNVSPSQLPWIQDESVYYLGISGKDIRYPEDLLRSTYLGPAIFFDEPMVHTRDQALRPRFEKDPSLRKRITPEVFFEEFKHEFHMAKYERSTVQLLNGLRSREDVDLGDMDFLQQNVYSWETMIASAYYQLSEGDASTPAAIVFEPPGRFGARRVLPELNMCFDCQIPADDPKNLIGIIKGFTRGAARATDKTWGISIYGQVVRSEAYWYMTHAYEQGATHFFYWDSYQLAAVPYSEYLSLSRNLREHAKNFPRPDLKMLNQAAEVAILLPKGYNHGHVKMGIGNIGGLPELNRERVNSHGVKYREVMSNLYIEIERCIRLGVEYDLLWNFEEIDLSGYREVVTIREDGKVDVANGGKTIALDAARMPERPEGNPPRLELSTSTEVVESATTIRAVASVSPGTAPVYYTQGANRDGIYRNTYVLWELFGPEEEDYTDFWNERWFVEVLESDSSARIALPEFTLREPGMYRLRASTADMAGRSAEAWSEITIP